MSTTTHHLSPNPYDIVICGAGLVGSTLALALIQAIQAGHLPPLRLAIIEKNPLNFTHPLKTTQNPTGERAIVLSYGSYLIYQNMGLFSPPLCTPLTPIHQVHVSEHGRFGVTHIKAEDWQLPALGYVVLGAALYAALTQALEPSCQPAGKTPALLTLLSPATIKAIDTPDHALIPITLHDANELHPITTTLSTHLLVGADGTHSTVRRCLNLPLETPLETHPTANTDIAIMATITTSGSKQPNSIAYERFTPSGPIALLPLSLTPNQNRYKLVWSLPSHSAQSVLALDDHAFLKKAQSYWGRRVGDWLEVSPRTSTPLHTLKTTAPTQGHTVLIGNAAQTLHPVAAQGLNLGLRDITRLVDSLSQAYANTHQINDAMISSALQQYTDSRQKDQALVGRFTHTLTTVFGYDTHLLSRLRGVSLALLDLSPCLKKQVFRPFLGQLTT